MQKSQAFGVWCLINNNDIVKLYLRRIYYHGQQKQFWVLVGESVRQGGFDNGWYTHWASFQTKTN